MVPDGELPANKYGAYSKLFVLAHEAWKESEDDRPPVYGWSYANNNYSVNNNNNNYNNKNLYKTRTPIKHDPNFNGPRPNRGCTDVIFLLLFICFLGAWGYVAYYGFRNGDPQRFLRATDSSGRKCGVDSEVLDKPYLFFFDLTACAKPQTLLSGCDTPQVCVKECPKASWNSLPYRTGNLKFDRSVQEMLICTNDQIKNQVTTAAELDQKVKENECASWYIPSRPLQSRCLPSPDDIAVSQNFLQETGIPNAVTMLSNSTINMSAQQIMGKVIHDLYLTWRTIVVILTIAILISLFYIALLRWIAGIVTWLSLLAVLALLITFSILSYLRYDYLEKNGPVEVNSPMIKGQLEELANKGWLFLTLTIVCGVIALILFLLIVFLRKRIQIAITLIKEGSKAVSNVISSLFFPIIPWCLQALILMWFIFIWMSLSSVGDQVFKARFQSASDCICSGKYQSLTSQDVCAPELFSQLCKSSEGGICKNAGCHFYRIDSPQIVTYFHVFNVFGIFWAIWFVIGMSDMILAGTFAKWYWTMDKRNVPFFAVTASAGRTVRYHLGTIAFGSLIIAICSFIRACIEYAEKKVKGYDNSVVKALFCCLKCFFWCLEKFLRFINKNAYIMCAIHGRNFCLSAKDAFNLLMRNMIRVVVLDKVTDFLFFIGKLVISGGMVVMAHFLFFNNMKNITLNYNSTVPCVVIAIGSYIIASIFFGVYSMAVDTLFLCFLEDCERNDGSVEKPYFMSTNLMQILGKKNRKNK